jgi:hypothetical protein
MNTFVEQIRQQFASMFIAFGVGALTFYFSFRHFSGSFSGKTDIIGYPIFANFNNYALLHGYILSLATCLVLLFIIIYTRNGYEWRKLPFFSVFNLLTSVLIAAAIIMKNGQPSLSMALIAYTKNGQPFFATVALIYACQYFLNAVISFRSSGGAVHKFRETREAGLFSLILLAVPVSLYIISGLTGWTETSGQLTHLIWFSKEILIVVELAVLCFIFRLWQQNASLHFAKDQAISYMVIPALIFLITTCVHGTFTIVDMFHSGESLVTLTLGLKGALPWRDFLFVHGVWQDFLKSFVGTIFWEHSLRAGLETHGLLVSPLYWISLYVLFLKLFRDSYLKALVGLVICYAIVPDPFRFPLYPFVLLSLYQAFASSRKIWFVLFSLIATVEIFISPEFGVIAFGLGCAIIAKDLLEYRNEVLKFQRILVCALSTLAIAAVILAVFYYFGLLDGFLVSILHFSRGHLLTGGVPIQHVNNLVWVAAVPVLFIVGVAYLMISKMALKQRVTPFIYLLFGLAIGVAIYFLKYIGRPDGHIYHTIAVAVPGIALLMVYSLDFGISHIPRKHVVNARRIVYVLILWLLMQFGIPGFASTNWIAQIQSNFVNLKHRLNPTSSTVEGEVWFPGVALPGIETKAKKLREYFAHRLQSDDTVFDFSDSPALFYSVLQLNPASRFIHTSMAIRPETQQLLIADLEKNRPKYVIYQSPGGLNGWDGIPNEVRHYMVAAYINRHYFFDQELEGALIFRRTDINATDLEGDVYNQGLTIPPGLAECRLGYIPNFFIPGLQVTFSPNSSKRNTKNVKSVKSVKINGWAAAPTGKVLPEIQVVQNGLIVGKITPNLVRVDVDKAFGRSFGSTGFSQIINFEDGGGPLDFQLVDQRTKKISKFAEDGWLGAIDSVTILEKGRAAVKEAVLELETVEKPLYLRLKFDHSHSKDDQPISIVSPGFPGGRISFTKTAGADELILPLGGCYVWAEIVQRQPVIIFPEELNLQSAFFGVIKGDNL